jgi:hypothetical protein
MSELLSGNKFIGEWSALNLPRELYASITRTGKPQLNIRPLYILVDTRARSHPCKRNILPQTPATRTRFLIFPRSATISQCKLHGLVTAALFHVMKKPSARPRPGPCPRQTVRSHA